MTHHEGPKVNYFMDDILKGQITAQKRKGRKG